MNPADPNEQLSEEIVSELFAAGLIRPSQAEQVKAALMTGKCRPRDWRSWAEDFVRQERTEP
jgi:hypothetical protein